MNIHFRIEGIPALYKLMNKKKKLDINFSGTTLNDFTQALISKFGQKVKGILLDDKNEIDIGYRVVVNMSKYLSYGQRMDTPLHEGDTLHVMIAG